MVQNKRETLGSRLSFLLLSAGCAIGLGNVWRFPYVVGENGGALFLLIYFVFLILLGVPIMTMEFAVGRASRQSVARSFAVLAPHKNYRFFSTLSMAGNYLVMMMYTTISGWMIAYFVKMLRGDFLSASPVSISAQFDHLMGDPWQMVLYMGLATALGFLICLAGLKNGVERLTKWMMLALLALLVVLCVRTLTLPGAGEGIRYYLVPDFSQLTEIGFYKIMTAALGQAFFTLSIGMGGMAIFGSYLPRTRTLAGESLSIILLDTAVAVIAGLIVIPACFAYGLDVQSGEKLAMITLPNVFSQMPMGRWFGALFFLLMIFAALSSLVAVFENILCFGMDLRGWSRAKSVAINLPLIFVLSLPCALGFNLFSFIQPLGAGSTILQFEDFLICYLVLPLGCLGYVLFCTRHPFWGLPAFLAEANTGRGLRLTPRLGLYLKWILPLILLSVLAQGFLTQFIL